MRKAGASVGRGTHSVDQPPCRTYLVIVTISGPVPGLFGMALIVLSCVAYKWISPMVGGQFFDRHANLRVAQRHLPPAHVALVGLGLVVFALTR